VGQSFADAESGFEATLFENTNTGERVLSFRGTDADSIRGDWLNRSLGTQVLLQATPSQIGLVGHLPGVRAGQLHSINQVVDSLQQQIYNDCY
jgi:hypothetical protein